MCFINPGGPEEKKIEKKIKELEEDRSKAIRRLDVIEQLLKGNGKILALQYEEIKVLKSILRKSKENKIKFAHEHLKELEDDNEDSRYIEACKRQIKEAEGALEQLLGERKMGKEVEKITSCDEHLKQYLAEVVDKTTDCEAILSKLKKENIKLRKEIKELKERLKRG